MRSTAIRLSSITAVIIMGFALPQTNSGASPDSSLTTDTFHAAGDRVPRAAAHASPGTSDCPIPRTGDVNNNDFISSSDIIYLVTYIFKGGPEPLICPAVGDINCDGAVNSGDVVKMVNYVFKRGGYPCDVCTIIPDIWTCP